MAKTLPSAPTTGPTNALAVPAFRSLWINSVTFYLVSNALRFVYGWVILDGLDRGEAWQGAGVFVLGLPLLFLLMPAGVWADRFDPKRMLIVSQAMLLAVMVATALGVGSGAGSLPLILGSALLAGVATAVGSPVRGSLIPALLSGELLYSGIALNAIAMTLSLVLGAVAARQFGDWFGFDGAFWFMAVLLVVGLIALTVMQSPGPANAGDKTGLRDSMREGVAFVRNDRGILTLFGLLAISGGLMSPTMFVTTQAHIKEELGRTAADAAPLFALMGLGIMASSIVIMRRGNMANKSVLFMRAMLCGTTTVALMGMTTAYWQILALGFFMGLCGGFFINMNQGLIQGNTPKEVMGRVMGLYALVQAGLTPIGALVLGGLADVYGTRPTMVGAGALAFAMVLFTYLRAEAIRAIN